MNLFLDTAVLDEIKAGVQEWGVITGVTTNPTLIARAGQDHETQVKKICEIVGNVSAECVSEKKDDLIVEGRRIATWHKNVIVKVPMTPDGLGAGKILAGEGHKIDFLQCRLMRPFPAADIERILKAAKRTVLIEENYSGQLGALITEQTGVRIDDRVLKFDGRPFSEDEMVAALRARVTGKPAGTEVVMTHVR